VCSQRACHTRLGTPLYFAKIVFPKNAKSGKNRQKSAKSLKIAKIAKNDEKTRFLPLFHTFFLSSVTEKSLSS
jgi:hypothetical protein